MRAGDVYRQRFGGRQRGGLAEEHSLAPAAARRRAPEVECRWRPAAAQREAAPAVARSRPSTVDQYCTQFPSASCGFLVACGYYEAQSSCETFYSSFDYCAAARVALSAGRVRFDAALAAQCVSLGRANTTCTPFTATTSGPDCRRVFDGLIANTHTCLEDSDCVAGSYCTSDPKVSCGGACQPKKQLGAAATRAGECATGLSFYAGACVTPQPVGAACSPVSPSLYPRPCVTGAICDNTVCRAYRRPGESCSSYECFYGECRSGTCGEYIGLGGACGTGLRCAADLACLSGHCAPLSTSGGSCSSWVDCTRDLYCSAGTCVPRKTAQASCSSTTDCRSGLYCDATQHVCLALKPVGASCTRVRSMRALVQPQRLLDAQLHGEPVHPGVLRQPLAHQPLRSSPAGRPLGGSVADCLPQQNDQQRDVETVIRDDETEASAKTDSMPQLRFDSTGGASRGGELFALAPMRDSVIGETVLGYKVTGRLGSGGMGIVYQGEHAVIGKRAAIKVLRPEIAEDQEQVRRLQSEAKAVNAVGHRGIVDVFGYETLPDGRQCIVMEFLDGEALNDLLTKNRTEHRAMSVPEVMIILEEMLSALSAAHSAGVVHRRLETQQHLSVPTARRQPLREAARLRHGQAGRRRADAAIAGEHAGRHAVVHGARTGARRSGEPRDGSLRSRRGRL